MSDLISRSALIEKLEESIKWCEDNLANSTASFQSGCIAAIKDIIGSVKMEETCPSIDAEPVKHGHWIRVKDNTFMSPCYECSACGRKINTWEKAEKSAPYCHCGAKMDEVTP